MGLSEAVYSYGVYDRPWSVACQDSISRAGHTRQLLRQSDTVLNVACPITENYCVGSPF